ncbi:MAG TPA: SPOR domain-containing protein [Sphingobacteriaceae bacterium]|nr:SPOR domain-containing protein [Sphingobacteriaceae bacterium]
MKIKRLFFFASFFCLFSLSAFAQRGSGKVELIEDSMIPLLQQKRIEFESNPVDESIERKSGTKGTVLGFRVQIYTGPSRSEAYAAQSKFQRMYSDVSTYVSYTQPNYRVKVGDFRSRSEAQALMRELRKDFTAVFLFTEQVNVIY